VIVSLMAATALAVVATRSVFASVMLMGIFSLLSATLFVVLDAVDVAFTEAAVGAGISTVLFLTAIAIIPTEERPRMHAPWLAAFVCVLTGALLIYGTFDMPPYGDPTAPVHTHVADRYLAEAKTETGVPNVVTAVLAGYRGYDTLGETVVVCTAAIAVIVLIGRGRLAYRRRRIAPKNEPEERADA
jgi:multicomponent Na+:H+ antiporter subunit B